MEYLPYDALTRVVIRRGAPCIFALLASLGCTTSEGGGPNAASTSVGGLGQVATGRSGGASGAQDTAAGGSTASGGSGSEQTTEPTASTGGVGAGGGGAGGSGTHPHTSATNITGGSGTGGAGTGGLGTGGTGTRSTTSTSNGAGGSGAGGSGFGGADTGGTSTRLTTSNMAGVGSGGVGTGGTRTGPVTTGGVGVGTGGVGTGGMNDTVTRTASTFAFKHFPIQTNGDGVWNGPTSPGTQATTTTYNTVVLENAYLRVTLLPDYGGRILSMLHKPTNHEFLYQNPLGTPYLMGEDIFYYDYLVIMGGIFPSFPEPEHGKYWNQPYELKVVSESKDAITVRMSRKDDRNLASGVPAKYDVGRTDVLVELDVTLRAGSTSLELGTKLTNTQNKVIPKFEYWTVTTLAPGSIPGQTAIPLNTRIMAAMEKVHLLESSWSWFGSAEERVSGEIFKWNNLSYFKNWVDQGTAFANPDYRANWSGLMNYDNSTGILRVSDNSKTPGLKLWTFGKGSLSIDINDSNEWLRPTIEMWHGITPEFWNRGTMAANEVRQWSQNFFPTLGLKEVTAASQYGALQLSSSKSGENTILSVAASLTLPNQIVRATLRLNGSVIGERDVLVAEDDSTTVSATVANNEIAAGAIFEAVFSQGATNLLTGRITLQ